VTKKALRPFHVSAALTAITALMFAAASCRDVVAGDTVDVIGDLCEQLEACYGTDAFDCDEMQQLLRDATPAANAAFLKHFDPASCIGTCPGALACLDIEPFCGTGVCATAQDCCGWSSAEADCAPLGESTRCCKPDGIECTSGEECCNGRCENEFCGGASCVPVGDGCSEPAECCTLQCVDDICAIKDCADLSETCATDDDCCPFAGNGPVDEPIRIVCDDVSLTCVAQGDPDCSGFAATCDPASGVFCCGDLECVPGAEEGLVCNDPAPTCGVAGQVCELIAECCDAHTCNPSVGTCTACLPLDAPCIDYAECCSLSCKLSPSLFGSVCSCDPGDCHDPCLLGDAMSDVCTGDARWGSCIAEVLARDAFCGCDRWDELCVQEAEEACGLACAEGA